MKCKLCWANPDKSKHKTLVKPNNGSGMTSHLATHKIFLTKKPEQSQQNSSSISSTTTTNQSSNSKQTAICQRRYANKVLDERYLELHYRYTLGTAHCRPASIHHNVESFRRQIQNPLSTNIFV